MSTSQLSSLINPQRFIALMLMILECAVVVLFARTIVFPAIVLAATLFGFATRWRVKFDRKLTFNLAVFLWLGMLAQYGLLPSNARYNELFAGQQVTYLLAQYLMCVQAAYFFVLRADNLLPSSFPLLGAGALASLAIVQLRPNYERPVLQALHAIFVIGALLFWGQSRRLMTNAPSYFSGRSLFAGATAAFIAASGCGVAWAMARYETQLDRWVVSLLNFERPTTDVGFAETSRIGAVRFTQSKNSNQIALRVTAESEPGYFRGKVYDSYFDREWHFVPNSLPVERVSSIPEGLLTTSDDGTLYRVADSGSRKLQRLTVHPNAALSGIYFAPLETAYLQTRRGSVIRDQHHVLRSDEREATSYRLFVSGIAPSMNVDLKSKTAQRSRDHSAATAEDAAAAVAPELDDSLFVPRTLRENARVLALRDDLFRNATTTRAKIAAVENYFSHYQYGLDVSPPPERDPIEWFLTEKPDAHCEYFGSGTVMLLRLAGVPSRYVTGFVIDEQNPISGDYVARNKDAHAWAEARLNDGHWELIETTPGGGRPSQNGPADTSAFWEAAAAFWDRLKHDLNERGLAAMVKSALMPVLNLIAVAAVFGASLLGLQRYRRARKARPQRLYQPHAFEAELQKYDRVLSRLFRQREPSETLSQYAAALESAAKSEPLPQHEVDFAAAALWYRDYERRRFGPQ